MTAYLDELIRKHPRNHGLDLDSASAEAVFVPALPLFEEDGAGSIPALSRGSPQLDRTFEIATNRGNG